MQNTLKEKGYTMVELGIYVAIAAIVLVTVTSMTTQLLKFKADEQRITITYQEAQRALEKIIFEVRRGDGYSVVNESKVELFNGSETITVELIDGQIYVTEDGGTDVLTTDVVRITQLQFEDWTSPNAQNLLHIEIEIEKFGIKEKFETSVHARSPY